LPHRSASGQLVAASVAVSCAVYVTREEHQGAVGEAVRRVWGFRPVGVVRTEESARRLWLYVRPGLQRPLACPPELGRRPRGLILVFDLNGVLCAKLSGEGAAPSHRGRLASPAHVRTPGGMGFVFRPGASKLLRVCAAAGHEVWLWSTMQRSTVDAVTTALAPWIPPGRRLCAQDCTAGHLKDLRRIWAERPGAEECTMLFDDDATKGAMQPRNVVVVPRFELRDAYDLQSVCDRGALEMLAQVVRKALM
jgi:hypothetical protein